MRRTRPFPTPRRAALDEALVVEEPQIDGDLPEAFQHRLARAASDVALGEHPRVVAAGEPEDRAWAAKRRSG